ncbi:MAG: hypothetical protein DRJ42_24770 [Deltaproteobacteria bacterium]|nr:MAG: hypothetical protein DRJ42_24770 [Deltaproteobacteria bacterium]
MGFYRSSVAMLFLALTSCGGATPPVVEADNQLDVLKDAIRGAVDDEDRAARLVAAVEEIKSLAHESRRIRMAFLADIQALNADYDSPREAFITRYARYDEERAAVRHRFYPLRSVLVEGTTVAEWDELQDANDHMLEALAAVGSEELEVDDLEDEPAGSAGLEGDGQ